MDIHKGVEGLTAEAVAGAYEKVLEVQKNQNCPTPGMSVAGTMTCPPSWPTFSTVAAQSGSSA